MEEFEAPLSLVIPREIYFKKINERKRLKVLKTSGNNSSSNPISTSVKLKKRRVKAPLLKKFIKDLNYLRVEFYKAREKYSIKNKYFIQIQDQFKNDDSIDVIYTLPMEFIYSFYEFYDKYIEFEELKARSDKNIYNFFINYSKSLKIFIDQYDSSITNDIKNSFIMYNSRTDKMTMETFVNAIVTYTEKGDNGLHILDFSYFTGAFKSFKMLMYAMFDIFIKNNHKEINTSNLFDIDMLKLQKAFGFFDTMNIMKLITTKTLDGIDYNIYPTHLDVNSYILLGDVVKKFKTKHGNFEIRHIQHGDLIKLKDLRFKGILHPILNELEKRIYAQLEKIYSLTPNTYGLLYMINTRRSIITPILQDKDLVSYLLYNFEGSEGTGFEMVTTKVSYLNLFTTVLEYRGKRLSKSILNVYYDFLKFKRIKFDILIPVLTAINYWGKNKYKWLTHLGGGLMYKPILFLDINDFKRMKKKNITLYNTFNFSDVDLKQKHDYELELYNSIVQDFYEVYSEDLKQRFYSKMLKGYKRSVSIDQIPVSIEESSFKEEMDYMGPGMSNVDTIDFFEDNTIEFFEENKETDKNIDELI